MIHHALISPCTRHEAAYPRARGIPRLARRAAVAGAFLMALTSSARAQWTVYDPVNYAENVLHYVHQLMQIQYQLQALAKLPTTAWRDVTSPLTTATEIMATARSLGYAARNVPTTFAQTFAPGRVIEQWPTEEASQAQSTVNVMQQAVSATADGQSTVSPGLAAIQHMKALNDASQGHEQALELGNTASIYGAEELMLLRQTAMTQTNIQAVYYANALAAEAQRDASIRAGLAALAVPSAPQPLESLSAAP